jgi:hypothetical protein
MRRLIGTLSLTVALTAGFAQVAGEPVPVFDIQKPTIIAFYVPDSGTAQKGDEDGDEALADYQYYIGLALPRLRKAGIDFEDTDVPTFKIRSQGKARTFRVGKISVGYYFVAPGKKPHVEYGVMTDADMIDLARSYFGISIP